MIFLAIFSAKMVISIAPAFSIDLDKTTMNNVIMQLELEQNGDKDATKKLDKPIDSKFFSFSGGTAYKLTNPELNPANGFVERFKRYVTPYHPSVPTPPPNFS